MDVLYISNIAGNIERFHFPEILEEDNVPSYGSGSGSGSTYTRTRDSKRESITTVISPEYEREILQVAKIHHNIYPNHLFVSSIRGIEIFRSHLGSRKADQLKI